MPAKGPMPKRIEERRRRNVVPGETTVAMEGEVAVPVLPKTGINPIARQWFDSLKDSGQSQYFEPSDWAMAVIAAKVLTKALSASGSAAQLGAAWQMMDGLMTTEAGRRRNRVFVQRGAADEGEAPTSIDDYYRKELGVS